MSWYVITAAHAQPTPTAAIRGYTSGTGRRDVLKRVTEEEGCRQNFGHERSGREVRWWPW
jgi:hypothetical protein